MSDCIFGIKCNGVSIEASQISIEEDQSRFDYICNVSLKDSWNGNGTYEVSIINKDYIQGLPVGKWRLSKAWITYNWGDSSAKLVMEDEDGNDTCDIIASTDRGSAGGFHVPSLARTIFTKAQEVVRDYPNAKICSAIIELHESQKKLNISFLKEYCLGKVKEKGDEEYVDNIEYVILKLSKHFEVYKKTKELLKEQEDQRSKQLLKDIITESKSLLDELIDKNNTRIQ